MRGSASPYLSGHPLLFLPPCPTFAVIILALFTAPLPNSLSRISATYFPFTCPNPSLSREPLPARLSPTPAWGVGSTAGAAASTPHNRLCPQCSDTADLACSGDRLMWDHGRQDQARKGGQPWRRKGGGDSAPGPLRSRRRSPRGIPAQRREMRAAMAFEGTPFTPGSGCVHPPLFPSISLFSALSLCLWVSLSQPLGLFVPPALCSVKGELK